MNLKFLISITSHPHFIDANKFTASSKKSLLAPLLMKTSFLENFFLSPDENFWKKKHSECEREVPKDKVEATTTNGVKFAGSRDE